MYALQVSGETEGVADITSTTSRLCRTVPNHCGTAHTDSALFPVSTICFHIFLLKNLLQHILYYVCLVSGCFISVITMDFMPDPKPHRQEFLHLFLFFVSQAVSDQPSLPSACVYRELCGTVLHPFHRFITRIMFYSD